MDNSLTKKKPRVLDTVLYVLIYFSAAVSVLLLAGIIGYVFIKGAGSINLEFLTRATSAIDGTTGIAGNIINTLYIIFITLLIATPRSI